MTATVMLPRLDIPITGRSPISDEWYRWARDITARTGGVESLNSDDLLQAPPVVPDVPVTVDTTSLEQTPPLAPAEVDAASRVEQYAPPITPAEQAIESSLYSPPQLPLELTDLPATQGPAAFVLAQEGAEWLPPVIREATERVEWLENRVNQLQAVIESMALQIAGLEQGNTV